MDVLGDAPDFHCIPVGNAGNITAYWRGYLQYKEIGSSTKLPKMLGFQAAGAAPIVEGHPIEFYKEPSRGAWQSFKVKLLSLLPLDREL